LRIVAALILSAALVPPDPCAEFDALYAQIRDRTIARDAARSRVAALIPEIRARFYARGGTDSPPESWRFPLERYGAEAIGGRNGSGYMPSGYDWFDGSASRGHPGHDLFIHDRNQDELDDATGQPVNVVSMTAGIVVATAPEWTADSVLRGGRYIYIYSPQQNGLFYYAHNREIVVKPGDIVVPGQRIATVGRSGRNAAQPRSPTHLHVMFLAIEEGYPRPRDIYRDLERVGRPVGRQQRILH
jgi:murein DD-endopeptidase MepM/ murein hydrolase activator NlpD